MTELGFSVLGARIEPYAAVPTMVFRLRITESTGARIHTMALRTQIQIEPRQRPYAPEEQVRLLELFGEPSRWGTTLATVLWTHVSLMIPGFQDSVEVDMPVPCSYDFDVTASKYFHALDGGDIPLLFLFSGTLFARTPDNDVQVGLVPWHNEAHVRLPVSQWRDLMNCYFPNSAWMRLGREAFDALHHYKATRALMSMDEAVMALLEAATVKGESA